MRETISVKFSANLLFLKSVLIADAESFPTQKYILNGLILMDYAKFTLHGIDSKIGTCLQRPLVRGLNI